MLSLIPLLLHEADKSGVLPDMPDDGIQYVLDGGAHPMYGLAVLHMETSTINTQEM